MLDINLGNKTLVVGVLIALILSYGMVNFDSGNTAVRGLPWTSSAQQAGLPTETSEIDPVAQAGNSASAEAKAPLNFFDRRALLHGEKL